MMFARDLIRYAMLVFSIFAAIAGELTIAQLLVPDAPAEVALRLRSTFP